MTVHWESLQFQFPRLPYDLAAGTRETHLEHNTAWDSELPELSALCRPPHPPRAQQDL